MVDVTVKVKVPVITNIPPEDHTVKDFKTLVGISVQDTVADMNHEDVIKGVREYKIKSTEEF